MTSNYFRQYITGYTFTNFNVIQADIMLQKQEHWNMSLTHTKKYIYTVKPVLGGH